MCSNIASFVLKNNWIIYFHFTLKIAKLMLNMRIFTKSTSHGIRRQWILLAKFFHIFQCLRLKCDNMNNKRHNKQLYRIFHSVLNYTWLRSTLINHIWMVSFRSRSRVEVKRWNGWNIGEDNSREKNENFVLHVALLMFHWFIESKWVPTFFSSILPFFST